jgi:uncharacterized membrane protein YdjX (TVP38/TMEM64 family)
MLDFFRSALLVLSGGWIFCGTIAATYGCYHIFAASKQAARQEWRRQTMGHAKAEANAEFFKTNRAFFLVFWAAMIGWPFFLGSVIRDKVASHH